MIHFFTDCSLQLYVGDQMESLTPGSDALIAKQYWKGGSLAEPPLRRLTLRLQLVFARAIAESRDLVICKVHLYG